MAFSKKSSGIDLVYNYLTSDNGLVPEMKLVDGGALIFHWANWKDTCLFQRNEVRRNRVSRKKLSALAAELEEYKNQKVWITSKIEVIETNLFELYQFYLDPRVRMAWLNKDREILVSLVNSSGPYVALSSMRWFSEEIYKKFVYHKILTGSMPLRSFRIGVNIPAEVWLDRDGVERITVHMKQLSESGILFFFDDKKSFFKFTSSSYMKVILFGRDWTQFTDGCSCSDMLGNSIIKCYDDIVVSSELPSYILKRYNNDVNIKISSGGGPYFFFVGYNDLICQHGNNTIQELLRPIVAGVMDGIGESLKRAA